MNDKKEKTSLPKRIVCNDFSQKCILDVLEKIKNDKGLVILEVDRIDMTFINKAYDIIGNRLRIMPTANQEKKRTGIKDYPYYTYKKILESEKVLNMYANTVLDHLDKDGDIKSLSPLEKYIAAYILTTKFARYKHEDNYEHSQKNYHKSRSVYEFVDKVTDRRIVCVGYANLLSEILYRMGITDTSPVFYYFVMDKKNAFRTYNGHARLLVYLIDSKYNIDGIYVSDPTYDEAGITTTSFNHMLMSKEEIIKDNPKFEMNLEDGFEGKNKYYEWEITTDNINNNVFRNISTSANESFSKPIPKDTIVKAFLAVDRFLDKNMKMVKDDSEYSFFEIFDAELKLGLGYIFSYNYLNNNKEKVIAECPNIKLGDLKYYSDATILSYRIYLDFTSRMAKIFNGPFKYQVVFNRGNNTFVLSAFAEFYDDKIFDELSKKWIVNRYEIINRGEIVLGTLSDDSINDQIDDLISLCKSFEDEYRKICSKSKNNNVK